MNRLTLLVAASLLLFVTASPAPPLYVGTHAGTGTALTNLGLYGASEGILLGKTSQANKTFMASKSRFVAIGDSDQLYADDNSVAIGAGLCLALDNSVCIGFSTSAQGSKSIAIGANTDTFGDYGLNIGFSAGTSGDPDQTNQICIGANTDATKDNQTVLGSYNPRTTETVIYGQIIGHFPNSYLASDDTSTSATFKNSALTVPLVAGRKYLVEASVFFTESTAADGVKIDWYGNGSSGISNMRMQGDVLSTALNATVHISNPTDVISAATFTGSGVIHVRGTIEPSINMDFKLRFAQNSHSTGTLTLLKGSILTVTDLTD